MRFYCKCLAFLGEIISPATFNASVFYQFVLKRDTFIHIVVLKKNSGYFWKVLFCANPRIPCYKQSYQPSAQFNVGSQWRTVSGSTELKVLYTRNECFVRGHLSDLKMHEVKKNLHHNVFQTDKCLQNVSLCCCGRVTSVDDCQLQHVSAGGGEEEPWCCEKAVSDTSAAWFTTPADPPHPDPSPLTEPGHGPNTSQGCFQCATFLTDRGS